jgi:hypothetical protein
MALCCSPYCTRLQDSCAADGVAAAASSAVTCCCCAAVLAAAGNQGGCHVSECVSIICQHLPTEFAARLGCCDLNSITHMNNRLQDTAANAWQWPATARIFMPYAAPWQQTLWCIVAGVHCWCRTSQLKHSNFTPPSHQLLFGRAFHKFQYEPFFTVASPLKHCPFQASVWCTTPHFLFWHSQHASWQPCLSTLS